jgi:uncharacterized membrane protein (DUF2068 family)
VTGIFKTLRAIAIFEGAKGAVVLLAGFGLLLLVHRDLQEVAERFIEHSHLNPASRYPHIFIDLAARTNDARLWFLAMGALAYATVRFVEAYGLWFAKWWAEWFAAAAGAVYIPFEVYRIFHGGHWHVWTAFLLNVVIVAVMIYALVKRKRMPPPSTA